MPSVICPFLTSLSVIVASPKLALAPSWFQEKRIVIFSEVSYLDGNFVFVTNSTSGIPSGLGMAYLFSIARTGVSTATLVDDARVKLPDDAGFSKSRREGFVFWRPRVFFFLFFYNSCCLNLSASHLPLLFSLLVTSTGRFFFMGTQNSTFGLIELDASTAKSRLLVTTVETTTCASF